MGDILNIITEDYELLDINHYYMRIYVPTDKSNLIKNKLKKLGVYNVRYVDLKWALENPNESCVYFAIKLARYNFDNQTRFFDIKLIDTINKTKNIKLIYFVEDESLSEENFKLIIDYIKFEGIASNKVYIYNNNSLLEKYKQKYCQNINVFKSSFLSIDYSKKFSKFEIPFKNEKKFLFLTQNKRLKPHRFSLLCFLKKNNILNETDWSFILNDKYKNINFFHFNYLDRIIETDFYREEIDFFCNKINCRNYHEHQVIDSKYYVDFITKESFEDSYINIVTESHFCENDIHITEKSFKPFYFYQIPIFISTSGHVNEMKKLYGYDFFDDFINHGYDSELDDKKRTSMIYDEILRIFKNKDKLKKYYLNNKNRFEKNKAITLDLVKINESKFFYNI